LSSSSFDPNSAKAQIQAKARELGFVRLGVTAATDADSFADFEEWLNAGFHGEMSYLERNREARRHPRSMLQEVQSVWMLAWDCALFAAEKPIPLEHGRIARYAWDRDYHQVLREKLSELSQYCREHWPGMRTRGIVDTAPLLERDFARRAGLGWIGKNCMLIHPDRGSFLLLAGFLTSFSFPKDSPFQANHCGRCTACIQACPTEALIEPGKLDARLCLSYLTIEVRGKVTAPDEVKQALGNWLFGCDICQDVCPWNQRAFRLWQNSDAPQGNPPGAIVSLDPWWVLEAKPEELENFLTRRSLERTGEKGLKRNALLVIGNQIRQFKKASGDQKPAEKDPLDWGSRLEKLKIWSQNLDEGIADAARWAIGCLG